MILESPSNGKEGRKQWWQHIPIPESWQSIETYRIENNQLRVEVARNNTQIRHIKEEQEE